MSISQNTPTKTRAAKKSKIATDYDPTPITDVVPDGSNRPETESWVSNQIVKPFTLDNHPLYCKPIGSLGTLDRKLRFLTSKLVSINGDFFVKDKETGCWKLRKRGEAVACLLHDWSGSKTEYRITPKTISELFSGYHYLVLDQTICIPGAGDFLWYGKSKCLNTWSEPVMAYRTGASSSAGFKLLIKLIWENVLGRETTQFEDIIDHILGTKQDEATWMFHWLASQYQRQGKHLNTTLWWIGGQGTGKGTVCEIIMQLLRTSNSAMVNISELKSGWNDFIGGNSFLIGDEIKMDSRIEFYSMLKRYVGNPRISLRRRNHGQYVIPNIANWLFTTNDRKPVTISEDDRRNTFIEGTRKPKCEYQKVAIQFHRLPDTEKINAREGLAELLHAITINDQFISEAFSTPIKQKLAGLSEKPVLMWLREEMEETWPIGTFFPIKSLRARFFNWASEIEIFSGQRTMSNFNEQINDLQGRGMISEKGRKTLDDGSRVHGVVRLDPECPEESISFEKIPSALPVTGRRLEAMKVAKKLKKNTCVWCKWIRSITAWVGHKIDQSGPKIESF